ncbi:MAG: signal peptide peptidase SppA [Candidatus Bostrichicola ureolyticus]|nr:MAG: signal peptide peptidase SppA [Candidatus Bostrichicola ureolyticus]
MKNIFKYALGTILGILCLMIILIIPYYTYNNYKNKKIKLFNNNVLYINNFHNNDNYDYVNAIINAIINAKNDKNIKGIIIEVDNLNGFSKVKNIRDALKEFKKSKKFIYAYGQYISQLAYYLCSVADLIYLHPSGKLDIKGLSLSQTFYKKFAKKIGIKFNIFRHGKYKSAVEPFLYDKISNESREQYKNLLSSIWNYIINDISKSRHLDIKFINHFTNELYGEISNFSYKYNFIDKIAYYDEFINAIKNKNKYKINFLSINDYIEYLSSKKDNYKNKIAIIYAEGLIKQGEGINDIQDKNYELIINKIINDPSIKSVVLQINSKGGDAIASENIYHKLVLLKRKKPLIVSMGDYATSGGYYIAVAGNKILASPLSITGSIGVFGIIMTIKELTNKLGITQDYVSTNKNSIPFSINNIKNKYKNIMLKNMTYFYNKFITTISKERKISKDKINRIAQGKIWSGIDALKIGLIDSLGNLNDAIKIAAKQVNLKNYSIVNFPIKKESFIKKLLFNIFKNNNYYQIYNDNKNLLLQLKNNNIYIYTYTNISIN